MVERIIVFKDGVKIKVIINKNWFIYVRSENIKVNKFIFFLRILVISLIIIFNILIFLSLKILIWC